MRRYSDSEATSSAPQKLMGAVQEEYAITPINQKKHRPNRIQLLITDLSSLHQSIQYIKPKRTLVAANNCTLFYTSSKIMYSTRATLSLGLLLWSLPCVSSFSIASSDALHRFSKRSFPSTASWQFKSALSAKNSDSESAIIQNEFSRQIPPERIRARSGNRGVRDYQTTITASPEECQALAKRFDLKNIESLSANVSIRAEPGGSSGSGVHVEGQIMAAVTQTCVRTSEDFPVQLEFPLYAIVRPVIPLLMAGSFQSEEGDFGFEEESSSKKRRTKNNASYRTGSSLDDLDAFELQQMLQDEISFNDDDGDDSALMEDEAIYPKGGNIDVGELVAQIFWLSLDPYPKKPGTNPIQTSISG